MEASQLETEGYVIFPQVYPPDLIAELRVAIDEKGLEAPAAIEAYERNPFQGIYGLGSFDDPAIPRLLSWRPALDALRAAGVTNPRFSSGYSLSKPGGGPALYWHRDWHHWSCKAESEQPRGTQLFLMVYLVDTTPDNGCLRVIPRSHLQHIDLDDRIPVETANAHGGRANWGADLQEDPGLLDEVQHMVSTWPEATDVALTAGDLVIGDSRLFHAAYQTMWYIDWDQCTPPLRAFYAAGGGAPSDDPCGIPCASDQERAMLEPLRPVYDGDAEPTVANRMQNGWGRIPIAPSPAASGARL